MNIQHCDWTKEESSSQRGQMGQPVWTENKRDSRKCRCTTFPSCHMTFFSRVAVCVLHTVGLTHLHIATALCRTFRNRVFIEQRPSCKRSRHFYFPEFSYLRLCFVAFTLFGYTKKDLWQQVRSDKGDISHVQGGCRWHSRGIRYSVEVVCGAGR